MGYGKSTHVYTRTLICDGWPGGRKCDSEPVTFDDRRYPPGWTCTRFSAGDPNSHIDRMGQIVEFPKKDGYTPSITTVLCPICSVLLCDFLPHDREKQKHWWNR